MGARPVVVEGVFAERLKWRRLVRQEKQRIDRVNTMIDHALRATCLRDAFLIRVYTDSHDALVTKRI